MALGVDGRVYMWGQNPYALLGGTDRGPKQVRETPTAVEGLSGGTRIYANADMSDGTSYLWGPSKGDGSTQRVPAVLTQFSSQ